MQDDVIQSALRDVKIQILLTFPDATFDAVEIWRDDDTAPVLYQLAVSRGDRVVTLPISEDILRDPTEPLHTARFLADILLGPWRDG